MEDNDRLARIVQMVFPGAHLLRAWPLSGGISAGMSAFEITLPTSQKHKIVLRCPAAASSRPGWQVADEEFRVLQSAHILGLAAPKPLFLDLSGQILARPYFLIEYIDGQPEFCPADLEHYTRQAAEHLARIHRAHLAQHALSFLPPYPRGILETISNPPFQMDASLEEARIRAALETAWPIPRRNAPALLHGDYWPGNLLWQKNQLVAVIDWEDAALGDPLADLAISRLDMLWIFGQAAMQTFTHQYQSHNPLDLTYLPAWDLCAALRLVRLAGSRLEEWAAFFHPYGRTDITEQTIREQYQFFVEQALEKLAG